MKAKKIWQAFRENVRQQPMIDKISLLVSLVALIASCIALWLK